MWLKFPRLPIRIFSRVIRVCKVLCYIPIIIIIDKVIKLTFYLYSLYVLCRFHFLSNKSGSSAPLFLRNFLPPLFIFFLFFTFLSFSFGSSSFCPFSFGFSSFCPFSFCSSSFLLTTTVWFWYNNFGWWIYQI